MADESEEYKKQDEKEADFLIGVEIPIMIEQIREKYPHIAGVDKAIVTHIFSLGFECGARHTLGIIKRYKDEPPQ